MDEAVSICLGVGLAAACGFRVFVPLLAISLAANTGHLQLTPDMQFIGTWAAALCLLTATALEIGGYYVPWIDNALDTIATPAAVVAGTMATASVVQEMTPLLRWSLALIAGGGIAALIQSATVGLRGTSTATTLGSGNFVVSTLELLLSIGTIVTAFMMPLLLAMGLSIVVIIALRVLVVRRRRKITKLNAARNLKSSANLKSATNLQKPAPKRL